ncbi:RpiB/LacA/LacB family sugar-phosphate isomerase [Candidatus Leptofilum sp.]|uniref:RpiB/LacA/LacB family sugar-phosphate isomerase n=1 Tax=Candidatus Leptofilum sp. TaxID=3241576 RepID=UPI003B5C3CE4
MKIAIGSDEKCHLTNSVVALVQEHGYSITLFGPLEDEARDWPEVAREVAEAVANGTADEGILFCWTGTGVSLAANKVPGIRAALCDDAETAKGARLWNNANLLCLSIRRTSEVQAKEILEGWFGTAYTPNEEDDRCLRQVETLEAVYRSKK